MNMKSAELMRLLLEWCLDNYCFASWYLSAVWDIDRRLVKDDVFTDMGFTLIDTKATCHVFIVSIVFALVKTLCLPDPIV